MNDLARARDRARRLYPRSKGFRTVYLRGAHARTVGLTADACPYPRDVAKTWRNAYRRAWLRGYESVH